MSRNLPLLLLLCAAPACVFDAASHTGGFAVPEDDLGGPDSGIPGLDDPETGEPDAALPTGADAGGGDGDGDFGQTCPSHSVSAEKRYQPDERDDGILVFDQRRTVVLPDALDVVEGNAGNHCAHLDLRRGDNQIRCLYLGGSSQPAPSPGTGPWTQGLRYEFDRCGDPDGDCRIDDSYGLAPGDTLEIDRLTLRIDDGAYRGDDPEPYDPTRVEVVIDEVCD